MRLLLTRDTSGDDDHVGTGEGVLHAIVLRKETLNLCGRGNVREIGSNTGSVDNIVERELADQRA